MSDTPDMYTGECPVASAHKVWAKVQRDLGYALGQNVHKSWTGRLHISGADAYGVSLKAPTGFIADKVENTYSDDMQRLWDKHDVVAPPRRLSIVKPGSKEPAKTAHVQTKKTLATPQEPRIAPAVSRPVSTRPHPSTRQERFTFENFIVGQSNEFAHAAARQVAMNLETDFNPVVIHGQNGMGKTHLLYACLHMASEKTPDRTVLKISGEQFVNMFVGSFKTTGRDAIEKLKNKLRGVDLLMIDDAHFITSRPGSQEELLLTLIERLGAGRQIVMTSDVHPDEMDQVSPRLKSLLSGGLICKVGAPDYELRRRIVDRFVELRQTNGFPALTIPHEARDHLAARINATPRDLEGAFNQVIANSQLLGRAITLETVQDSLSESRYSSSSRITVERIQRMVCKAYNISMDDMVSKRRSRVIARPRQVAMFLCKKLTTRSLPDIGRRFGGRDHSTVIHAVKKVSELCAEDTDFNAKVESVEALIKTG